MEFTEEELTKTHPIYDKMICEWKFYGASYAGLNALKELRIFKQHERESSDNFERRKGLLYTYGFSQSVVDLLIFFLFQQNSFEEFGDLENNRFFQMFMNDSDLEGRNFSDWLQLAEKNNSTFGSVGVLVDRPAVATSTVQSNIDNQVYAFVSLFSPENILDWEFGENEFRRPELAMVKLIDQNGLYRIWFKDTWHVVELVDHKVNVIDQGDNPLGEIPFFWMINQDIGERTVGRSDIGEIANVDLSITNNASQLEEIVNYSAFPMLMEPEEEPGTGDGKRAVGVKAVLKFDPDRPESKPDWLKPVSEGVITTLLEVINEKIRNIYRSANLSGVTNTFSNQVKSGESLKREFKLLNAKLCSKSGQVERAEREIIRLWGLWQGENTDDVDIRRSKEFDVQALGDELDDILTSLPIVNSRIFENTIRKRIARKVVGQTDEKLLGEIDVEIDSTEETDEPT